MKKRINPFILTAVVGLMTACTDGLEGVVVTPEASVAQATRSAKIVNVNEAAVPNMLLLKLETAPTDEVQAQLAACGLTDLRPVFPSMPGKEEQEKRFGLDRWYDATLAADADADAVADAVCLINEVTTVQFNNVYQNEKSDIVIPVSDAELDQQLSATRAAMEESLRR